LINNPLLSINFKSIEQTKDVEIIIPQETIVIYESIFIDETTAPKVELNGKINFLLNIENNQIKSLLNEGVEYRLIPNQKKYEQLLFDYFNRNSELNGNAFITKHDYSFVIITKKSPIDNKYYAQVYSMPVVISEDGIDSKLPFILSMSFCFLLMISLAAKRYFLTSAPSDNLLHMMELQDIN
jgi:hypothetical protein